MALPIVLLLPLFFDDVLRSAADKVFVGQLFIQSFQLCRQSVDLLFDLSALGVHIDELSERHKDFDPLNDGTGLKLTVSKYLTPNGRDINRRVVDPRTGEQEGGLVPDIVVERPDDVEFGNPTKDPQLARAVQEVQRVLAGAR